MTCRSLNGSPTSRSGMSLSTEYIRSNLDCVALTANVLRIPNVADRIEKGICSTVIRPASILEMSRMSSMMRRRELARFETIMRFSRCWRVRSVSRVTPVRPMILRADSRQCERARRREGEGRSAPVHWRPDLVRHVRQELRLGPIRQLGRLPRHRVLLQRVTEGEDHLVDLRLERVHLSRRFDRDERAEVAFGGGGRNLGKGADLRGQVQSHGVDVRL